MKLSKVFPETRRKLNQVGITAWILAIAFLTTACGGSTPTAITEPSPQPIDAPPATISDPLEALPRFKHFTVEDGLSHNVAFDLLQDASGFLWIGSRYGLNRYDGSEIKS